MLNWEYVEGQTHWARGMLGGSVIWLSGTADVVRNNYGSMIALNWGLMITEIQMFEIFLLKCFGTFFSDKQRIIFPLWLAENYFYFPWFNYVGPQENTFVLLPWSEHSLLSHYVGSFAIVQSWPNVHSSCMHLLSSSSEDLLIMLWHDNLPIMELRINRIMQSTLKPRELGRRGEEYGWFVLILESLVQSNLGVIPPWIRQVSELFTCICNGLFTLVSGRAGGWCCRGLLSLCHIQVFIHVCRCLVAAWRTHQV